MIHDKDNVVGVNSPEEWIYAKFRALQLPRRTPITLKICIIPKLLLSGFWPRRTISAFMGLAEEYRDPLLSLLATEDFIERHYVKLPMTLNLYCCAPYISRYQRA